MPPSMEIDIFTHPSLCKFYKNFRWVVLACEFGSKFSFNVSSTFDLDLTLRMSMRYELSNRQSISVN